MSYNAAQPPAGWYPDPAGSGGERFWDGAAWSQATRDAQPAPAPAPAPQEGASPSFIAQQTPRPQTPPAYGPQHGPVNPQYQVPAGRRLVPGQGGRPLAGFGKRIGAWALDYLLTLALATVLTSSLSARVTQGLEIYLGRLVAAMQNPAAEFPAAPESLWADYFLMLGAISLVHVAYRVLTNGLIGATLGERVLKLSVARAGDESLAKIGWATAIVRGLFSGFLVALGFFLGILDLIFAAFTQRRQALHDMVAKVVVYER
ncbi:RDD family protein [Tessaracoccus caeni]|uniref:RDD family protein n=1 Tax=Tessaracoccus caeni TaxID=3031239 RepID=UPI0023DB2AC9|nr:RDD family protein [Tessaracoccus caeni]MDF1488940.1 RDD family protein [Tessaracoccus caeni]